MKLWLVWLGISLILFSMHFVRADNPIFINSCRALNQTNGYYILQNNVNSTSNCFIVGASNVSLNLNGYTINGVNLGGYGIKNEGFSAFSVFNGSIINFLNGISLQGVSKNNFTNINFISNRNYAVYIDMGINNTISYSYFTNHQHSPALTMSQSSGNVLINNVFSYNNVAVEVYQGSNNTFVGGIISHGNAGVDLSSTRDNILKNIVLLNNTEPLFMDVYSGQFVKDHCRQTVQNLTNNGKPVLYIRGTQQIANVNAGQIIMCDSINSTLTNVSISISGPEQQSGIYVFATTNTILLNILVNNTYRGIYFDKGSNNNFISNSTIGFSQDGIVFYNASNNIVSYSRLWRNGAGIHSDNKASINNSVVHNWLEENWIGLFLERQVNSIYYDNFINSTSSNFVLSNLDFNYFNTYMHQGKNIIGGRFLGGNFWAQPDGKGFSETCADKNWDGLCDSPYVFDENNRDEIPLARKNRHDPQLDK